MNSIVDGLILGCSYALLGWGFAANWIGSRYLNVAVGDLFLCILFLDFSLSRQAGSVLLMIPFFLIACECAHRYIFRRASLGDGGHSRILLTGIGLGLTLTGLLELVGQRLSGATVEAPRSLRTMAVFDLEFVPHHLVVGAAFVLGTVIVIVVRRTRLGRAQMLLRENPVLMKNLGLEPERVAVLSRAVGGCLFCLGAGCFFLYNKALPTTGIQLTITAYLIAAAARRRYGQALGIALLFGSLDRALGGPLLSSWTGLRIEAFWSYYLALALLGALSFVNPTRY